jgi:L-ribulose-5-phosphate 4-epimerase
VALIAHAELRERVFEANREIVRAGLVVLTFGNASGVDRTAGVIAIKPSGVGYEELRPESMVVIELESGDVVGGTSRPSSDTPTHLVLYRRFGSLGGIVHTHSPSATAWAQAGRPLPCFGTTHADHFHGAVPVTRELTSEEIRGEYEARTGDVIVETIEALGLDPLEMPAVLVRSHGPFAWGADEARAVENAIALETTAALGIEALALTPDLSPVSADLLEKHFRRKHGPSAYYGQGSTDT